MLSNMVGTVWPTHCSYKAIHRIKRAVSLSFTVGRSLYSSSIPYQSGIPTVSIDLGIFQLLLGPPPMVVCVLYLPGRKMGWGSYPEHYLLCSRRAIRPFTAGRHEILPSHLDDVPRSSGLNKLTSQVLKANGCRQFG